MLEKIFHNENYYVVILHVLMGNIWTGKCKIDKWCLWVEMYIWWMNIKFIEYDQTSE